MASPFVQSACEKYDVTVLAKDYAHDLHPRFWPGAKVVTFHGPWTAFCNKYQLWRWPWKRLWQSISDLRRQKFDFAVSARWDPRDHLLMWLIGARHRFGFPRVGSQLFLTRALPPNPTQHRYEHWRAIAALLDLPLPPVRHLQLQRSQTTIAKVVIHTGASLPLRVWPLERFQHIARSLRDNGVQVIVACDAAQRDWWVSHGESNVFTAKNVAELIALLDSAKAFIGNDSGPGHLAAICGVPTFTIFGPALPERIAPIHPKSRWIEGKPCEFKPCKDDCRFASPFCLHDVSEAEVHSRLQTFFEQLG